MEELTAIDPVCGMSVDINAGKPSFHYEGVDYHFCCAGCRQKFSANPERYTGEVDPDDDSEPCRLGVSLAT